LLIALVVVIAGGGYWWYSSTMWREPSPPEPSWEYPTSFLRYSRFGLSFEYPEGMVFTTGSLLGGFDHAHPLHGDVQGSLEAVPEIMGVIWAGFEEEPPLEALLDHLFNHRLEDIQHQKAIDLSHDLLIAEPGSCDRSCRAGSNTSPASLA